MPTSTHEKGYVQEDNKAIGKDLKTIYLSGDRCITNIP